MKPNGLLAACGVLAVLGGLVWALYQDARDRGYSHFVISGVTEQRSLYEHLGFLPLGPPVGDGRAAFVPMWLPVGRVEHTMGRAMHLWKKRLDRSTPAPQAELRPYTPPGELSWFFRLCTSESTIRW